MPLRLLALARTISRRTAALLVCVVLAGGFASYAVLHVQVEHMTNRCEAAAGTALCHSLGDQLYALARSTSDSVPALPLALLLASAGAAYLLMRLLVRGRVEPASRIRAGGVHPSPALALHPLQTLFADGILHPRRP